MKLGIKAGPVIGVAAVVLVAALAALPGALGTHETEAGPGPCTFEPGPVPLPVADARGHDVVCVDIVDFAPYDPATVVVDPGATVVWRNVGGALAFGHTATLVAGTGGDDFNVAVGHEAHGWHTFEEAGTYYYQCQVNALHVATMHGAVVVQAT